MQRRKRIKKDGRPMPSRGLRLPRKRKFEPELDTAAGVKVRSKYEQRCVAFLERHGIRFQYEPLILLDGKRYRPDFYLPDYNLFLEICGYRHMPHYIDRQSHKEQVYNKRELNSLFINYNGKGSLEKLLRTELERVGVVFESNSE
jgi:hypothetical protein